jgi:hypothetical protein
MATIQREIEIARDWSFAWDAIRDVGAIHRRLVPGFVVDCKLEGDSRIITFANGMVIREVIVTVNDETCRHAWSARGEPFHSPQRIHSGFHGGPGEVSSCVDSGSVAK